MVTVNIMTINEMSNPLMSQANVDDDLDLYYNKAGIYFFQEMLPDRYSSALTRIFNWGSKRLRQKFGNRYRFANLVGELDFAVRASNWNITSSRLVPVHKGIRHITPARKIGQVGIQHKTVRDLKIECFNVHPMNKGHNPKHQEKFKELWPLYWHTLDKLVDEAVAAGKVVTIAGDFNRVNVPKFNPAQKVLTGANGIDKIIVIDVTSKFNVTCVDDFSDKFLGRNTDHKPKAVKVRITRKK